jgi:4-amino-4-deoxy-L-arabinose transferase-like glycosyltransferase
MIDKMKIIRNYNLAAVLFCIFIFILSLIIGDSHIIGTFGVETDFYGSYAIQAKNILDGKPYTSQVNPPGYPILISLGYFLTGDLFTAGKILSSISTALLGLICYFIFKKLFTEQAALVSVIFLSIILIPYSFLAATDIVGAAFASIPILILITKDEIKSCGYLIIGITCGAAYLIRIDSIFVLFGIIFSILFILTSNNWKKKLGKIGLLLIGFILITSPWFIYNWKLNGSPFATKAYEQIGYNLYDWKEIENEEMVEQISENNTSPEVFFIEPVQLILNYLTNIPSRTELFVVKSFVFPCYLFLGGGIFFFLKNLNRKRLAYFVIWLSGFILLGLISFNLRHYFAFIPFACFLIAYFLLNEKFLEISGKINLFIWFLIAILILFLIKDSFQETKSLFNSEPKYLLQAADFLKSRSSEDEIVICRKPHIAYLSGLRREFFYEYSAEDFFNKAKLINARYIVYSDFEYEIWPGLYDLSNPDEVKDFFTLIYEHKPTNTLIYEVK